MGIEDKYFVFTY